MFVASFIKAAGSGDMNPPPITSVTVAATVRITDAGISQIVIGSGDLTNFRWFRLFSIILEQLYGFQGVLTV